MSYFCLLGVQEGPKRWIDVEPYVDGLEWSTGLLIPKKLVPKPYRLPLQTINPDSSDDGPYLPELFNEDALIVRDDLLTIMCDEGANNLQAFDAVLEDPENNSEYVNYKAVNILGLLAAADLQSSQFTAHEGGPKIDVSFDRLVIDRKRTHGALIFRLAESSSVILVHERLRKRLEKEGFTNLWFEAPEDIAT